MNIDFKKTWEQRQAELVSEKKGAIPDGVYNARILSAYFTKHDIHQIDVLNIEVEITEGSEQGKRTTKTYFLDETYKNARKRKWDEAQFYTLLKDFNLKFENERELFNVLYELKDKEIVLEIRRGDKTTADGKQYVSKFINVKQAQEDKITKNKFILPEEIEQDNSDDFNLSDLIS